MSQRDNALRFSTDSSAQTRLLAAEIARLSRAGDLIVLAGDLGAGKTVFVQGFAAALGVTERVTSPTFALVQLYEGDLLVNHLDVYRLAHVSEIEDLGLAELLDGDAVTLVEWGDMIASNLPQDYLEVTLQVLDSDDENRREVTLTVRGPSWRARSAALSVALDAWSGDTGQI